MAKMLEQFPVEPKYVLRHLHRLIREGENLLRSFKTLKYSDYMKWEVRIFNWLDKTITPHYPNAFEKPLYEGFKNIGGRDDKKSRTRVKEVVGLLHHVLEQVEAKIQSDSGD